MVLNFYYHLDFQKNQGGYKIMKHTVLKAVWIFYSTYAALTAQIGPRLNFHIGNVSREKN
jgi:hypothetical protein